ncbi:MAG: DnaJ domain-containing protein [Chloroflexota bacterium]
MSPSRGQPDGRDYYKTLQVDPEADPDVIGAAYRKLAQRYHPDVSGDPTARARMAAINAAWEILRDPARRAAYDRDRRLGLRWDPEGAAGQDGASSSPPATHRSAAGRAGSSRSGGTSSSGLSSTGQGERWRSGSAAGTGETQDVSAGPPPGVPSGSVLTFGRYRDWSLGEVARRDPGYLEWLERVPIGRQYRSEIGDLLRRLGRR